MRPKKLSGVREKTLSFKVTAETDERLKQAAAATKLTPSAIALTAVDAALAAIERDGGIVMPPHFVLTAICFEVARRPSAYQLFKDA